MFSHGRTIAEAIKKKNIKRDFSDPFICYY